MSAFTIPPGEELLTLLAAWAMKQEVSKAPDAIDWRFIEAIGLVLKDADRAKDPQL